MILRRLLTATILLGLLASGGSIAASASNGPTVIGAGSTWVQIALDQWRADIYRQGYSINYQGVGSSAGRSFYIIGQTDFAASEIPFQPNEVAQIQSTHRSYQYVPDVAGGTSLMYNLHTSSGARITNLRLDANTAARIFTGLITDWHDPAIAALNAGLPIREGHIVPVVRSDGSGTSAQFSLYLQDQAPSVWHSFELANGCAAPCSNWPTFTGAAAQSGSDGVANFVANDAIGSGAIGYVEAGYAYGRGFPVALLHNASGNFAPPTSNNVATALLHATLNADLTQNLTGVYRSPEANAYPMSSYSYLITPTSGFDPNKGRVLGTWMLYMACGGQREAAPLGYSPLPRNLVGFLFDAVRRIPGAPAPPPLDYAHCPNPTLATASGTVASPTAAASAAGSNAAAQASATAAASNAAATTSASAQAAAEATAGGLNSLGGLSGSAAALNIQTLSPKQQHEVFLQAESVASQATPGSGSSLGTVALAILLLAFIPMMLTLLSARLRRALRRSSDDPAQ